MFTNSLLACLHVTQSSRMNCGNTHMIVESLYTDFLIWCTLLWINCLLFLSDFLLFLNNLILITLMVLWNLIFPFTTTNFQTSLRHLKIRNVMWGMTFLPILITLTDHVIKLTCTAFFCFSIFGGLTILVSEVWVTTQCKWVPQSFMPRTWVTPPG